LGDREFSESGAKKFGIVRTGNALSDQETPGGPWWNMGRGRRRLVGVASGVRDDGQRNCGVCEKMRDCHGRFPLFNQ